MPDGIGNTEQVRAIAEQVGLAAASAAVREFEHRHPHLAEKVEMPALMKWIGGIAATIVAAAIIWMAATLNSLQMTVTRIDERQQQDISGRRLDAVEGRVTRLEEKIK